MARKWSEEDEKFLRANYPQMSVSQLAQQLGFSPKTIRNKIKASGLAERPKVSKPLPTAPPSPPKPWAEEFSRGMKILYKKEYTKAIESFQKIAEAHPNELTLVDRCRVLINLCHQLRSRKRYKPQEVDECYYLGVYHSNRREYKEALKCFEEALTIQPENEKIVYLIASTYALIGNRQKAIESLKKAIKLDETNRIHARYDPDFESLYGESEFKKMVFTKVKKS